MCLLGKDIYRAYAGLSRSTPVDYGRQTVQVLPPAIDFVAPNPSGRSTVRYAEKLLWFRNLRDLTVTLSPDR